MPGVTDLSAIFDVPPLLVKVAIAIAIGALIGLERERRSRRKYAGLRTLALLCGAGPVAVFVAQESDSQAMLPVVIGLYLLLAITMAIAVAVVRFSIDGEDIGFTTSVTVVLVALLGILVGMEYFVEAASIAIITTVVLAERDRLHRYVEGLTDQEVRDSLKLGALVFVLYPVLPATTIDPYGVVAPREVLLFAIFVLLIQFTAYALMRTVGGSTGLAVTGLLAGAANSFAAAAVLTSVGHRSRAARDAASFALLLTVSSMMVRNVAIAGALAVGMVTLLVAPTVVMVGIALLGAVVLWQVGRTQEPIDYDIESPFSFRAAAKFAGAYLVILLVAVAAEATIGDAGLYGAAVVGGLVSSAAVAVTAATVLNEGAVSEPVAVGMVILGIVASLAAKIALVEVTNRDMRAQTLVPLVATLLAGVGAFGIISLGLPVVPIVGAVIVVFAVVALAGLALGIVRVPEIAWGR